MNDTKVIVCDLDGTLAPSKGPLGESMAETISAVLKTHRMAVISGASIEQFKIQFLSHLPDDPSRLKNLYLFPVNGSAYYVYDESDEQKWKKVYLEELTLEEKKRIYDAYGIAIEKSGIAVYDPYGKVDILEDRGGQVTFSGWGQEAPLEVKEAWDPDKTKRAKIVEILKEYLPDLEVRIGGATSIDITRKGIDKAYAIRKIEEHLKVGVTDIVFLGDALFPGGNDASVKTTGVECIMVSGPEETEEILKRYAQ